MAHLEKVDVTRSTIPDQIVFAQPSIHWTATAPDPNDQRVIEERAQVLAAAWRPAIADHTAFICDRIEGKSVLDIGCVAHDDARMQSDSWLHKHVAASAKTCVGVDILDSGVDAMIAAGFDVVLHDLSYGLGPLAERGPFQAIVAGELIEHVSDIDMLFAAAADGLTIDGELILTTPNPYAPARMRAGQRGDVWENVDHILYAFPSGIAELAERHGLVLAEAATTTPSSRATATPLRWMKRSVKRSHWHRRGFATRNGVVRPRTLDRRDRLDVVRSRLRRNVRFTGETFVYIVQRGPLL